MMPDTSRVAPPRGRPSRREGGLMRTTDECVSWVIYRMTVHGNPAQSNAVCEQAEWDAMELARPGHHTLLLAGITNEGEAERLARVTKADGSAVRPSDGA